jgi:hypothetical protein
MRLSTLPIPEVHSGLPVAVDEPRSLRLRQLLLQDILGDELLG